MSNREVLIFNEHFERYYRKCVLFARSFVYDDLVAESIASEAMFVLWTKKDDTDIMSAPLPYLFGIIRNKVLHHLRVQLSQMRLKEGVKDILMREQQLRIDTIKSCDPHVLYSKDISHIIKTTLESLGPSTKRVFMLSRYEGMTYGQIAIEMGITEKTVEYHISKALRSLRQNLGEYLPLVAILLQL